MMTERRKAGIKKILLIVIVIGVLVVVGQITYKRQELPTSEHKLLLTMEVGASFFEDDYTVNMYDVYYDGSVEKYEYYDKYAIEQHVVDNNTGKINEKNYQLEEGKLQELYYILNHDFLKYDKGKLPTEFDGWNIKYYDPEGNLVHEFLEGGADLEFIERIVYIVYGR